MRNIRVSSGGDHTIVTVLPILRSLHKSYGPISVIYFDAHLDTWRPKSRYPNQNTNQSRVTHGTFFYHAHEEGQISNHTGIRCKLGVYIKNNQRRVFLTVFQRLEDLQNDRTVGFQLITTDDIDDLGIPEIIRRIRQRVGNTWVYLSLDIDVIDPGLAPATGTPEPGGWTTRELKHLIRGLAGLNFRWCQHGRSCACI